MATVRLNHEKVLDLMAEQKLRPVDLGKILDLSDQMINFILHHGGKKYAPQLARIFGCREMDLLVGIRETTNQGRKKGV